MTEEDARLYRGTRERISVVARTLADDQLAAPVPACPLWTVRDLLGHLAGACADLVSGNVDGAPSPAWTAAHVAERADLSVTELVDEWHETGTELERRIAAGEMHGFLPSHPYVDSGTHEADLHGVLGCGRGDPALWSRVTTMLGRTVGMQVGDTATLTVRTPDAGFTAGTGDPHTTVDTETYELFRAVMGRRSQAQIAAWSWTGPVGDHPVALAVLDQTNVDLTD